MQWNKRDLPDILPVPVLEQYLNPYRNPSFEAVAVSGGRGRDPARRDQLHPAPPGAGMSDRTENLTTEGTENTEGIAEENASLSAIR